MKKLSHYFTIGALALSVLTSCNKYYESNQIDVNAVTFITSITPSSRVANDLFEAGDHIYVTAYESLDSDETYSANMPYTYSNGTFYSTTPIVYTEDEQELRFCAVYPQVEDLSAQFVFTALADQTLEENFEASDLLVSWGTELMHNSCPALKFYHMMSCIVINIVGEETVVDNGVNFVAYYEASLDFDTQEYTYSGIKAELNSYESSNNVFKIIIAPQTINSGETIAEFYSNNVKYSWVADEDYEFLSGWRYTYNWDITGEQITLESFIEGWNDATINNDDTDDADNADNADNLGDADQADANADQAS